MEIKRRLIVTGNVQEIGFRFFIKKLASNFKIKKGSVKNLDDENRVEIYCECTEKEYADFLQTLNDLKTSPEKEFKPTDVTKIQIEDIQEYDENSEGFNINDIKSPFEVFYKDDDDKDSERFERGCLTIQHMQTDMNNHFEHWEGRFDKFGASVERLEKSIEIIANYFLKHGEKIVDNEYRKK